MINVRQAGAATFPGRLPINAGDPPGVFEELAKLLTYYRDQIETDVRRLRGKCDTLAELQVVGNAYVATIANNCPDPIIKDSIKRLAHLKFKHAEASTSWAH